MPIDPAKLLDWNIPDKTQVLSRKDVAFYALSVGLGHDPLDTRQLRFVDPVGSAFATLPSMALVMGYPGFWMADPRTGIDALRVVHTEQAIEWLAPLPTEGTMVGCTRVTRVLDRGPDRGALLYSERQILADGQPVARLSQTHLLRGDGGFGGEIARPPRPLEVETGIAKHVVDLATHPEQALLYRLNGDMNPIHSAPAAAVAAGFSRPILHGMCTFGIVTHALLQALCDYDPTRLQRVSLRFSGLVYPGDTLRTEIHADGAFRVRVLERDQVVVDNGSATLG